MFPSKGGSNPNINKWIDRRSMVYTYTRILFDLKKERNSKTCYNVDETWVHHDKWNKTQNDLCCMTPLIQDVYSSQTQREQNSSGQELEGQGNGELLFNEYKFSALQHEKSSRDE